MNEFQQIAHRIRVLLEKEARKMTPNPSFEVSKQEYAIIKENVNNVNCFLTSDGQIKLLGALIKEAK